jgi:hypothetical protein
MSITDRRNLIVPTVTRRRTKQQRREQDIYPQDPQGLTSRRLIHTQQNTALPTRWAEGDRDKQGLDGGAGRAGWAILAMLANRG